MGGERVKKMRRTAADGAPGSSGSWPKTQVCVFPRLWLVEDLALTAATALAHEDWSRYLPNFKKRTLSKRRKPFKVTDKSKKPYTPFPPAPEKSKVDLQIESGEYFLSKEAKQRAAEAERAEKAKKKKEEKKREREREFVPPEENTGKSKKRKTTHD